LPSCDIGLSTVMIKKSIFNNRLKFSKLKTKEDFVLWLKILKKGIKIYSVDKILTSWTKDPHSLSSSAIQKFKDGFSVYNKYMKFSYIKSFCFLILLSLNFLKKSK
jgi:teichuronic acid biosynthesis glycosyltransferase TuaG